MSEQIIMGLLGIFTCMVGAASLIALASQRADKIIYRERCKNYEERVSIISAELLGIVTLNKYCIARWEESVKECGELQKTNFELSVTLNRMAEVKDV